MSPKRGTSYAFPDFLEESGGNWGTPCFFLAKTKTEEQKKLVTQYSFTNFFIAKRRDRVQERGTRTVSERIDFNSRLLRKQFMSPKRGTSYAFPDFLEESGGNWGTPCFFLAKTKTEEKLCS
jgi:hypothetical protein